ncbi:right-handed parallel beta-helix repeat-containing protein [Methylobacterium organophilum]|uniref:right-handed parallel beta-helix repeat-containing protein n=1 Tax=Methylobacterium organophilum TaxID=410 RepID=UPI0019D05906|nr:right-handed parallel beta-helix repeat-containing protein [Methylobacterium organophilum]MBN6824579.1 right-handed parallel beta-helix repeat-containing protein [Methylobacterium organophilum]
MKRYAIALIAAILLPSTAVSQSSPNWSRGYVPSAGEINNAFAKKQDKLQYTPLSQSGGTLTGKLQAAPATINGAGLSILPGIAPTAPSNGDIWSTSVGLFGRFANRTLAIPGMDQNTGALTVPGGPTLGTYQNGQFTSRPYRIEIQGPGSAGDVSGTSVTPANPGATAKPLAQSVFPFYAARASTFGAVGNGTEDDAAALRAGNTAVFTAGQGGGSLTLDSYPGYRLNSGVVLNNSQQWRGGGATQGLKCSVATGPCTTLIGSYSALYNLPLTFVGTSGSGSVGVQMGAGEQGTAPVLRDIRIIGFDTGVDIQSNVVGKLDNVSVDGSKDIGIRMRNITNSDAGDWTWLGVKVDNFSQSGDLVSYESGGGLKVLGFKGLGGDIGWHMKLPDGTATQDFQFSGNSIENSGTACMKFERASGGTTGLYGNISIVGNEFAGCPYGLWFADAGAANAVIEGNNFSSISGAPIRLDPGANNIVIGKNTITGPILVQDNRTATTDEYGFIDRSDTVAINSGSTTVYNTAYTVTLPPFRGASIHVVFEGTIQGAGSFTRDEEFLLTSNASGALTVTSKSSTTAGVAISFVVDTSVSNTAKINYKLASGTGPLQGTATIVPLGKMITVSR